MIGLLWFVLALLVLPFRSKTRLQAEIVALRHQLIVLQRQGPRRVTLTNHDRWFFVQLYRWFPSILQVLQIIRPETLVRWHRAGFRSYWRWKSRNRGGRPQIDAELQALIRLMSVDNSFWGAPRIHGEFAETRVRGRSINRREVHGQTPAQTAGSELVDISAQSFARHRRHGSVCRADSRI
jgi:hypothetical protein